MLLPKNLNQINTDMFKKLSLITLITLFMSFTALACSDDSSTGPDADEPSIVEIAADNEAFSTLVDALVNTGVVSALEGDGPFTVFAPTNDAFDNLPEGTLESLSNDQLAEILTYHVIRAEIFSSALQPEQSATTLSGEDIFVTVGNGVRVNNSATVVDADLAASNGVIHVVDGVILPDAFGDIVDNAAKRYFLSSLVEAVVTADLAGALSNESAELTVFAPTNEAFEAIADVAAGLTVEELTNILLYHVVDSRVLSTDLAAGEQTVQTLNGESITINVGDGGVTVNGSASVTAADVNGTNGVIHVINEVLLP